jgi:hypothetical protein
MRNITSKIQIRVLVPAVTSKAKEAMHVQFQEWVCERFGGFSVNPSERINGAWLNPETGKIERDVMMVYYIWLDMGSDNDIIDDSQEISLKVIDIFGEKAVSIIRDNTVTPAIYS